MAWQDGEWVDQRESKREGPEHQKTLLRIHDMLQEATVKWGKEVTNYKPEVKVFRGKTTVHQYINWFGKIDS